MGYLEPNLHVLAPRSSLHSSVDTPSITLLGTGTLKAPNTSQEKNIWEKFMWRGIVFKGQTSIKVNYSFCYNWTQL